MLLLWEFYEILYIFVVCAFVLINFQEGFFLEPLVTETFHLVLVKRTGREKLCRSLTMSFSAAPNPRNNRICFFLSFVLKHALN